MKTSLHLGLVACCLAVLVVPAVATIAPIWPQRPIAGVEEEAVRPRLQAAALLSEAYQRAFTTWFEQRYGARPAAVRLDNSISYWLFGEARPEKRVRVGRDRVLFLDEQLYFYNGAHRPDAAAWAARAARAQALLHARGKELVVILLPSKAMVWEDALPPGWVTPLAAPRPCEVNVARAFPRALADAGVTFVDGRAELRELARRDRGAVYTRVGRHLTAAAACLVLERALELARPRLASKTIPALDCSFDMHPGASLDDEEVDLWRLLEVWGGLPTTPFPHMREVREAVPRAERPDTLVVGSSFGRKLVGEALRNKALGQTHFYYYNRTFVDREADVEYPLEHGSPRWRATTFEKDLYLLAVLEEYLPDDGKEFLEQVIAHLEDATPAAGAR